MTVNLERSKDGAELIARERRRQIYELGHTPEDDLEYKDGTLLKAALCYAEAARIVIHSAESHAGVRRVIERHGGVPGDDEDYRRMVANPARHYFGWDEAPSEWSWGIEHWKPSPSALVNLIKAGALIAAEFDQLADMR